MSTLLASAKLENLERSFDAFVDEAFAATFSAANNAGINYRGAGFDEGTLKEWIEPWLLGPARPDDGFGREVRPGVRARLVVPTLQINIFVRPSMQTATIHRLAQLRDLVVAAMPEGRVVRVRDYAGDSGTIGGLILDRVTLDQEIPAPGGAGAQDLRQWAYSITARWTEEILLP